MKATLRAGNFKKNNLKRSWQISSINKFLYLPRRIIYFSIKYLFLAISPFRNSK